MAHRRARGRGGGGLDAPVGRVATLEVPIPYAIHLETAALPQAADVVAAVRAVVA